MKDNKDNSVAEQADFAEQTQSTEQAQPSRNRTSSKNTKIRDVVTMGIFIALFVAVLAIAGIAMALLPLIMILLPIILGVLGGLIFSVLLGKVQRPGAFLISSVLIGLFLITMAPGGTMCYWTIIGGVLAEIIYSKLGRRSFRSMYIAYAVYMLCFAIGEYIPFVWMKQAYLDLYANQSSLEVARLGTEVMNPPMFILLCVATVIAAIAGCFWGRALTRKQFARAGIV